MKKRRRNTAKPPTPTGRPSAAEFFTQDDFEDAEEMFRDYGDDEEEAIPRRGGRPFTAEDEPPPRWRRPAYDHDDDDEEYREPEEALRYSLRRIESHRQSLENERASLQSLLRNNPRLAAKWAEFTAAGGVSSNDWEAFLNGKFRAKLVRTRKHLRVVSNSPRIRLRRRDRDGPDEAA